MNIAEVVEFINSHDDPTLTEEMNALVMETCYRTHRLTMQLEELLWFSFRIHSLPGSTGKNNCYIHLFLPL